MKTLKAMCAILALALSLSISTYAETTDPGDGHSPGSAAPAPTPIRPLDVTTDGVEEDDLSLLSLGDVLWAVISLY